MLIDDFLARSAERYPDKVAVVGDGKSLTYGEMEAQVNRLARLLREVGVGPGERVAVFLPNRVEAAVAIFAILRAGGAFVVLNPSTKARGLAFMLSDCGARAIVAGGRDRTLREALATHPAGLSAAVICGHDPAEEEPLLTPTLSRGERGRISVPVYSYERDCARFSATPPEHRAIDADLAAIVYTSGSTGRSKGVAFAHFNVVSAARSITQYLGNVPEDVVLNVLPLSFTYGLHQLIASVYCGGTLVLLQSYVYPYEVVRAVMDYRVTGIPGVPTFFAILLQMKDLEPGCFDSVRYVTNAGAALPPAHFARLRQLFRKARIFSMYGVTECVRVSYLPPEELEARPASVGKGMPNQELDIVDERGRPVGPGEVGELIVRGNHVMRGYWNLPEETERSLRPGRYPWERWLYTGDLFRRDEEGYLYFVARKDDIIKSRGEKVSPREVENVICELPDVLEVAVVGAPDPILGQVVKAIVVKLPDSPLSKLDVVNHCARLLENYKVPKIVEFRDGLPKTMSGKVRKVELREETAPREPL
ncbi:AMP-binding protein [bacterium]|nr:AMP-binding protein [bacterium]